MHTVSEKSTFFLENVITKDKMRLRTSAFAHFIQNSNIFDDFF